MVRDEENVENDIKQLIESSRTAELF